MRQSESVRIACLDEVDKHLHENFRHGIVVGIPSKHLVGRKISHLILDVGGMHRTGHLGHGRAVGICLLHTSCKPGNQTFFDHLRTRMAIAIAIDRRVARSLLQVEPFPCRIGDKHITAEFVTRQTHDVGIFGYTIFCKHLIGRHTEPRFDRRRKIALRGRLPPRNISADISALLLPIKHGTCACSPLL